MLAPALVTASAFLAVFAAADPPADTQPVPSFAIAREGTLKGDFEQAVRVYEDLAKSGEDVVRIACGRAEIDLQTGDYIGGIARLQNVAEAGKASADWHACLAALLAEVGRYDEAVAFNRRALEIDAADHRARRQLGSLCEMLGRVDEAVEVYRPFDELVREGPLPDRPEDLTDLGRGFYRFSVLTRNPNLVQRARHVLTELYQEAFDVLDPLYWPARLAAAELLLEKHNLGEARVDFQAVRERNAKAAEAHVGLGRIALEQFEFDEAQKAADAALAANANCVPALLLLADLRMVERKHAEAATQVQRALTINPKFIEALSLLAAAQLRSGDKDASQRTQERVYQINPRSAVLHHVLGVWLAAGREFDEAERQLKKAIEFAPTWPDPRTELGRLYMETGEETLARKTLEAAFEIDSFNSLTHGILGLLDKLDKFTVHKTEHFILKFDEQQDGVIGPYFAEALERVYPDVCAAFDFKPAKPTIVEVFPDHFGFSVRISHRPFIATIGACSGRVIAMSAPRRGVGVFGQHNWVRVLGHEFAHTVTLAATENRIPHWLTEGCAEWQEHAPKSWAAKHLLSKAVRRDRLFTLESIDWGFARPRRPDDRQLAYAQSEWMVEYIIERFSRQALLDLLRAFREEKTQSQAFADVLKLDAARFEKDFEAWAVKHVDAWGLPAITVDEPDEIRKKLRKKPNDATLLAQLAQAELIEGELDKADEAARRALELDENHAPAIEVFAHVWIQRMLGDTDEGRRQQIIDEVEPYLRRLTKLDPENPSAIKYLGYVEQSWKHWREAIRWYTRYQQRYPDDPDSYRRLASIYLDRRSPDQALAQLEQLFALVQNEPAVAKQVAGICRDCGQFSEAAAWYRRAIEIDPYDEETHAALGEACLATANHLEAKREFEALCKLKPDEPLGYDGLSRVYRALGNLSEAEAYKEKAEARQGPKLDAAASQPFSARP